MISFTHDLPPIDPYMPIFSAKGVGGQVAGVILSHRTRGVLVHYIDARTIPCEAPPSTPLLSVMTMCPHCRMGSSRRWKGYLAIQEARSGKLGLLEITHYAATHAKALVETAETLRGKKILLKREGKRKNGQVIAIITEFRDPHHPELPMEPNVEAALLRIWHGGMRED